MSTATHPDLTDELQRLDESDPEFGFRGFNTEDSPEGCNISSPHLMAAEIAAYEKFYVLSLEDQPPINNEEAMLFDSMEVHLGRSFVENLQKLSPTSLIDALPRDYAGPIWETCEELAGTAPEGMRHFDHVFPLECLFRAQFFAKDAPPLDHRHASVMMELNTRMLAILHRAAIYIAKQHLKSLPAPFCLSAPVLMPADTQALPSELRCWLYFECEEMFEIDFKGTHLLHFYGVWAYPSPSGMRVASVAKGSYFMNCSEWISQSDLLYITDAYSCELSDIAKHLVGDFIKSQGMDWEEYLSHVDRLGFATPHLYVAPEFRGQGLSKRMLDCIADMTTPLGARPDIAPTQLINYPPGCRPSDICDEAAITVFVMQVEGTEPPDVEIEVHKAMSMTKQDPLPVVDLHVEKRRRKLSAYFEGMSCEEYTVTTYNPWDYPVT